MRYEKRRTSGVEEGLRSVFGLEKMMNRNFDQLNEE
jgi:hypothetical protein